MRIIDSFKEKMIKCSNCYTILSYTADDVWNIDIKSKGIECPVCGNFIKTEEFKRIAQFPDAYYHFSKNNGSKEMSNDWIEKEIKTALKYCLENKKTEYTISTGDTEIIIHIDFDDDWICVTVTKDFYEIEFNLQDAKEIINS